MKKLQLHETKRFARKFPEVALDEEEALCSCGKEFYSNISLMLHQDEEWEKLLKEAQNE